ncbi:hypothetical protein [Glycomyces algeriensis]|uniref:Uncharacterized protein n=1 Tax=Glycomyces algeriensis TaxID=256037 RepID=A0A9W6LJJ3_9ACTN|nr:hypothetical protein [Glycomyces algeriensis]MDA1368568.1 hypothetical protein [Glycomyces algeriensis]MDR7352367.1 hypothetical protein [Glycomyces algeriensis]GLI45104.1 hypothetical protein GALLR39Z86_49540 [Glycomyces algeriensis]
MALKQTSRPGLAVLLRKHRLAVVAAMAPLVVLLAAAMTAAAPSGSPEQAAEDPNFRRVALTSLGATFEILGQPEPLGTGAFHGEVDLARHEGEIAMTTANLVLGTANEAGPFGRVSVAIRTQGSTQYEYNPVAESIVFDTGLEFEADAVPGMVTAREHVYLYTNPIRLLPTEPVDEPVFPPFDRTFALPGPVLLWEGEGGVTGAEPVGMLNGLELTITHPA